MPLGLSNDAANILTNHFYPIVEINTVSVSNEDGEMWFKRSFREVVWDPNEGNNFCKVLLWCHLTFQFVICDYLLNF